MVNFRIFSEGGYSDHPVTEQLTTPFKPVIYLMTSIFNGTFSRLEPVKYMMEQTDEVFARLSDPAPIFYVNSAELQRITQDWMFPHLSQKKSDPIKNGEKKWLDKLQRSEEALTAKGHSFSHKILLWNKLLEHQDYDVIHKFVAALLFPEANIETEYPNLEPQLREKITSDIASLSPFTQQAVQTFAKHNTERLKYNQENLLDPSTQKIDIHPSLYLYLAQEFSVFLILAKLDSLQSIQRTFSITLPISMRTEDSIEPIFSYPISASKDGLAEKTLSTFLKVQDLYHKYYEQLELPLIRKKLILIDSVVPAELFHKKEKKTSRSPSPLDKNEKCSPPLSDDTNTTDTQNTKSEKQACEEETKAPKQELTPELNNHTPLTSSGSSALYSASISTKIVDKIFNQFIGQHESNGSTSLKISYKNRITCDIVLLDETSNTGPTVDREEAFKIIQKSVDSVLNDDNDISITETFHYQKYCYRLTAERLADYSPAFQTR